MRITVLVDMSKPLCRGMKICKEDGKVGWVRFKYERLPNLCYWYGLLMHNNKDCDLWVKSRGSLTEDDQQYGGWLHAPSINPNKCTMVRVKGSNGSTDKDEHSFSIVRGEEMDTTENELLKQSKEAENPKCQLEETHGPKDFVAIPNTVPVQHLQVQQNFQETLKEIDLGLAKYDGDVGKEIHLGAEEGSGESIVCL